MGRRSSNVKRNHWAVELLDRAPKGRDEDAAFRGEGEWWWRRHDEYENT
jgi:predicted dithiol-disulfide oxidoreductase (DUF899 family)